MTYKTKSVPITKRSREEVLATAFYPEHSSREDWKSIETVLRKEGWRTGGNGLLKHTERGYVSPLGNQMQWPKSAPRRAR